MGSQRSADIVSGLFLAVLGGVAVVAALDIKSAFGERLPPSTLPIGLGTSTLVAGLILSVRAFRFRGDAPGIDWPAREGWLRLLVTMASLVVFVFLMESIGTALAALAFSSFLIWFLERRPLRALVIGVLTAAVIQVVFVSLLQLPFPAGILGR